MAVELYQSHGSTDVVILLMVTVAQLRDGVEIDYGLRQLSPQTDFPFDDEPNRPHQLFFESIKLLLGELLV
ncbi:unnamed protein product [Haemonchus placei]|uniref:Uncharacterized protein n=1 Tax=Haemonchus placei TaxID=6290 RepID=A0A0N4VXX0_HAEPC|nr:unnamed protein product [Haemonchus placei]